jgi:RNase adaptor protein for sRNA GlmZ degradation
MNDQLKDMDWYLIDNLSVQEAWTFFYTTYDKAMEQRIAGKHYG